MDPGSKADFFISYTRPDAEWAEWIAWHLEGEGYTTTIQAWDFRPGQNFVIAMQQASVTADRTVAVISPAFFSSPFAQSEWAAAFAQDPDGQSSRVLPVRVRDCTPPGLHHAVVYIDLVDLDEDAARKALLDGIRLNRAKPSSAPSFPGSEHRSLKAPTFPNSSPPISNLPTVTRTFEGRRAALEALARGVEEDGRAAVTQTQAVHGLGGIGKTQLVARFALDHRDDYDVVWWIRSEQEATRLSDYAALGTQLRLPESQASDQSELIGATKAWLEQSDRWLLVFDNAPDPTAIGQLLPVSGHGHVLITSRRHADWRALGAKPLPLDVWDRTESIGFLTRRTGSSDSDSARSIANLLGDLPLALVQAAAYANEQAIGLSTLLARLTERTGRILATSAPLDYEQTVATTWDLAFEQIGPGSDASVLLSLSAYLAPERIPRILLTKFLAPVTEPSDGDVEQRTDDALQTLLGYALVTPAGEEAFDMHRLIQQVIRDRHEPADQQSLIEVAINVVGKAFPGEPWETDHWPLCAALMPHAEAAAGHAETLGIVSSGVASIFTMVATFRHAQGDYRHAKSLFERALAKKEAELDADHPDLVPTLGNLASTLLDLGDAEGSRKISERVLAIQEARFGPDHPEVAGALNNLSGALGELGDLATARTNLERAVAICERELDPSHREVARSLGNLGGILWRLGEPAEARAALERCLAIEEKEYGPGHPEVARTLVILGNALGRLGEPEDALVSLERGLAIQERTLGLLHPEVALTLANISYTLLSINDLDRARLVLERSVEIFEQALGDEHPRTREMRDRLVVLREPE